MKTLEAGKDNTINVQSKSGITDVVLTVYESAISQATIDMPETSLLGLYSCIWKPLKTGLYIGKVSSVTEGIDYYFEIKVNKAKGSFFSINSGFGG